MTEPISPLAIFDATGKFVEANAALQSLLGATAEQLLGRSAEDFLDKEELASKPVRIADLKLGAVIRTERVIVKPGGERLPVDLETVMLPDGRFRTIFHDATPRQKALEALRTNERQFRAFLNDLDVGVVVQSPSGSIVLTNPRAGVLLGLSEDQLLGRTSFNPEWRAIREDGRDFPGHEHPAMVAIRTATPVRGVIMGVYRPSERDYGLAAGERDAAV